MRNETGFTLIELMIVVAIVAIIAAVATSSYRSSVTKSYRADAEAALMEGVQNMERLYTVNDSYASATAAEIFGGTTIPDSGTAQYNVSIDNLSATTYTLEAAPVNGQTDDACGTLSITHQGVKSSTGSGSQCW